MITGVILARNEQQNIVPCLETLKQYVDEIILIDMESTDDTVALARPLVDQVLTHPLVPNFDAARNLAIPAARYDWLWFCDADERIPPSAGETVRDLVKQRGDEFDAISIPFKSYFCGKWIQHCGWWPGYTMPRVLKRGFFHFREQLHGGVAVDGREVRVNPDPEVGIDHFSYLSVEHYLEKFNRYTSTEAQQLRAELLDWDWRRATHSMVRDLWLYYERNQGHLDGTHGWILSWLSGQYRWAAHAKLIDERGGPGLPASYPRDLDEFLGEFSAELERLRKASVEIPVGLLWRSPIYDPSGYADEGRCFVKGSACGERPIALEAIPWSETFLPLPDIDRALFRALENAAKPKQYVAITNCIPTLARPDSGAKVNVLRTTFETDRLPEDWLPRLDPFDEIWVISEHNYRTFVRSGVPPETLRVVPSCIDTGLYCPEGPKCELPRQCKNKFVFLAVFDWQHRKGWDVLLRAYAREFSVQDETVLLLKVSRGHGHPDSWMREQANSVLAQAGTSLTHRPDIVFWEKMLAPEEMASLYRSVDSFVLASRGEGWGRPYMEAMACGLPVIGTGASGNVDFMNEKNSLLVDCREVRVSDEAAREIFIFRGHRWFEPDETKLRHHMRSIRDDEGLRRRLGTKAAADIRENFSLSQGSRNIERELERIDRIVAPPAQNAYEKKPIRVELEGEFLANHSFSNINETLAEMLEDDDLGVSIHPRFPVPMPSSPLDQRHGRLAAKVPGDVNKDEAKITVRHAYPPDWSPVSEGKWVHIQPWEFGHLPQSWIAPLQNDVDEIWAPSHYVRKVYEVSGVNPDKIHVIPWGIDPAIFRDDAIPRLLPTNKSFRFLYVGGTVARKGFDLALEAFLEEFSPDEDVCFVVKDVGHTTVYRYGNFREQLFAAAEDPAQAEIVYFDEDMTPGQLASLYAACDCLLAPYRGEGFGLPILEGMACGLPPVVPSGGPSDDFVDDECGYIVPSQQVEAPHPEKLCGPPIELQVEREKLRITLRAAFEDRDATKQRGRAAARRAQDFTWACAVEQMKTRLRQLASSMPSRPKKSKVRSADAQPLTVILSGQIDALTLADRLARLGPFFSQMILLHDGASDEFLQVALEYDAHPVNVRGTTESDPSSLYMGEIEEKYYVRIPLDIRVTEADLKKLRDGLTEQNQQPTIQLESGQNVTILCADHQEGEATKLIDAPDDSDAPLGKHPTHLDRQSVGFQHIVEFLKERRSSELCVLETSHRTDADGQHTSHTLALGDLIRDIGGRLISIASAQSQAEKVQVAEDAEIIGEEPVPYLERLARENPKSVDLLYLAHSDLNWDDPHPVALALMQQFSAAAPALKSRAMVVVDGHRDGDGRLGASLYLADYLRTIGAKLAFEGWLAGWILN